MQADYQLIIIGGGPAGLSAGLYAARGRVKALLLEKGATGGQVLLTDWVDNYPGFTEGISGFELIDKMTAHADRFDLEKKFTAAAKLDLKGPIKTVFLENGEKITCLSVILCTGARPRTLGVEGEKKFTGQGVSYCATCDGPFYKGQEIAVVGGGNTAIQEALHLTKFADKVTVIHRRDELRAAKILQEQAFANKHIDFLWNAQVQKIDGNENGVNRIQIAYNDGSSSTLKVTGIFILIGVVANNEILPLDQLQVDDAGFIISNNEMETSIPGVYAAGDIRSKNFRQIANAVGEGANAELSAEQFLAGLGHGTS